MSSPGHQPHPSGTSDGNYPSLPEPLIDELRQLLHGQVYARTDAEFQPRTTIFNGNVVTPAKAVVIPAINHVHVTLFVPLLRFEAQFSVSIDKSRSGLPFSTFISNIEESTDKRHDGGRLRVLKFCTKHGLFPSIKAGGYGTAGWSINGDVVVDLSKLNDIGIETPSPDGSFVSLRDTPFSNSKGKAKISGPPQTSLPAESSPFANPGKRRRSSEGVFDSGLPRDPLVAKFLLLGDLPSPAVRRRLDVASSTSTPTVAEPGPEPDFNTRASVGGAENMSRQSSYESEKTGRTLSSHGSSTSFTTSSTALHIEGGASDQKKEDGDALDVIASTSAGLHDQRGAVMHLRQDTHFQTPTPHVEPPPPSRSPSFSIRSEDPFGYMSAAPSASSSFSSIHPLRGYEQPVFQTGSTTASARPSTSSGSSSHVALVDSAAEELSNPPRPSFLSATSTPVHPNAFVSFGAGVKQKDIDLFTAAHPLPATCASGGVSSIAYHIPLAAHPVGSSVMLLGGFGFLSRLHGLSIDALVEVEMVLADGSIVFVNEKEHPDLWWALRGAGPSFGVVTRYKAIAYPVPVVFAGNLIYNFHAATAASLIKHFRDCIKAAPRELYANVLLTAGPADKGSLVVVQLCYIGAQEKGKTFLQAIASWDGEPCLLNEVSEKSFLSQQDSVAQILRGKAGRQWFIRSALITSLPDEVIHKTVNEFADTPIGCTWLFELAGGAVADAEDTCLPKAQREASFTIAAFHQWELDDDDPLCVTTAEHWINETLLPVSTGGPFPAFLGRHETAKRVMDCYGENWARLCEVKRKYDPHGLFKNTFWPLDVDGNVTEPCLHEPASPIMHPREL